MTDERRNAQSRAYIRYVHERARTSSRDFWTSPVGERLIRDYQDTRGIIVTGSTEDAVSLLTRIAELAPGDEAVLGDLAEGPLVNLMWELRIDQSEIATLFPDTEDWRFMVRLLSSFDPNLPSAKRRKPRWRETP